MAFTEQNTVEQSRLFTFYRQILAALKGQGGCSWWTGGFGARLTGWEASFGHLINLHLSSHPNITTCWSFSWGDSVSPERDLPDSAGEGGCRCLAEGCLRTRLKKAARGFVVLKVGCNCLLQCSRVRLLATPWTAAHQAPLSRGCFRQEHGPSELQSLWLPSSTWS